MKLTWLSSELSSRLLSAVMTSALCQVNGDASRIVANNLSISSEKVQTTLRYLYLNAFLIRSQQMQRDIHRSHSLSLMYFELKYGKQVSQHGFIVSPQIHYCERFQHSDGHFKTLQCNLIQWKKMLQIRSTIFVTFHAFSFPKTFQNNKLNH